MNKKLLLSGFISVLLVSIMGTYAFYTATASNNNTVSATASNANLTLTVTKKAGGTVLVPQLTQYLGSAVAAGCVDSAGNTACQVYEISISNTGTSVINLKGTFSLTGGTYSNLKWEVLDSQTAVKTTRPTKSKSETDFVDALVLNKNTTKTYYVAVWIAETGTVQNSTDTGTFNGVVTFNSVGGTGVTSSFNPMTATDKVMSLASISSSEILTIEQPATDQTTAQTEYRYWGATPSNYVWFNCDATDSSGNAYGSTKYSYSTTTCEKWRIIGVFETENSSGAKAYRLKIIRNESIGNYSWDNKNTTTGAESDHGSTNWSTARLMMLLNSGYTGTGGSLYYNRSSGTCYAGRNNATTSCDFTTTGLKSNVTTGNYIEAVKWYLGGQDSNNYIDYWWNRQRSNNTYSTNPASWVGEIGLMYGDDYGYAAGLACASDSSTKKITYNEDASKDYRACTSTNWLYNGAQVILSPNINYADVSNVDYRGLVYCGNGAYNTYGVRPTLYLEPSIKIVGGLGTSSNPYIITT